MNRRLFLDFDGTLIDSRQRQYNLFLELVPECKISFDEYWEYKRNNMKQNDMLNILLKYSDSMITTFKTKWFQMIEESSRLMSDIVIPGTHDFLAEAKNKFELCLITGRQDATLLNTQLKNLGLFDYFKYVLNTGQKISKAKKISATFNCSISDIFIGDTGEDILAGKELGMYTIAVQTGALNSKTLKMYNPDFVIDSISSINITNL